MKAISAFLTLLALSLMLFACADEQKSQTSQSPGQSETPRGTVLVKQLPAGAEGLELRAGLLRLKPGYRFVKQSGHRFAVARISDGRRVSSGGCGCTGGTCDPVLKGGIAVCEGSGCIGTCGLALTIAGVKTNIIKY